MKATRKFNWISSLDAANADLLSGIQARMARFYAENKDYYGAIDYTAKNWVEHPVYRDIAKRVEVSQSVLEVGCGAANILHSYPSFSKKYHGCDFSEDLMIGDRRLYPDAIFEAITDPRRIPYVDNSMDFVFSIFVIEHTIYPLDFLRESLRVLKPGGVLAIVCPDFMGRSRISSQCVGFGYGTGLAKLRRGRLIDAIITGFDNKIRLPIHCAMLRRKIGDGCGFYVNLAPVCFEYPFQPDHDAIYITYEKEIRNALKGQVEFEEQAVSVVDEGNIYLVGKKLS